MKVPSKPYQKAWMLAKAYQMIEKTKEIFDICNIHSNRNDSAFLALLGTLDKAFGMLQGNYENRKK